MEEVGFAPGIHIVTSIFFHTRSEVVTKKKRPSSIKTYRYAKNLSVTSPNLYNEEE